MLLAALTFTNLGPADLFLESLILLLELLQLQLNLLHALRLADAQLLDDLHEAPEAEHDDERRDLLDDAARQQVNDEAGDDDEPVEYVEPGVEVSRITCQSRCIQRIEGIECNSLEAKRPHTEDQLDQEQAAEDQASKLQAVPGVLYPRLVLLAHVAGDEGDEDVGEDAHHVQRD